MKCILGLNADFVRYVSDPRLVIRIHVFGLWSHTTLRGPTNVNPTHQQEKAPLKLKMMINKRAIPRGNLMEGREEEEGDTINACDTIDPPSPQTPTLQIHRCPPLPDQTPQSNLSHQSSWSSPSRISSLKVSQTLHKSLIAASTFSGSLHVLLADPVDASIVSEVSVPEKTLHVEPISCIDVQENGSECVSVGEDGRVNLVSVGNSNLSHCLFFDSNDQTVGQPKRDTIHVLLTDPVDASIESEVSMPEKTLHVEPISCIDVQENGSECVSVWEDGRVNLVSVGNSNLSHCRFFDSNVQTVGQPKRDTIHVLLADPVDASIESEVSVLEKTLHVEPISCIDVQENGSECVSAREDGRVNLVSVGNSNLSHCRFFASNDQTVGQPKRGHNPRQKKEKKSVKLLVFT
ncbi:unnamed protein product [Camellia sinensis]